MKEKHGSVSEVEGTTDSHGVEALSGQSVGICIPPEGRGHCRREESQRSGRCGVFVRAECRCLQKAEGGEATVVGRVCYMLM